jgi:hypothetical protein
MKLLPGDWLWHRVVSRLSRTGCPFWFAHPPAACPLPRHPNRWCPFSAPATIELCFRSARRSIAGIIAALPLDFFVPAKAPSQRVQVVEWDTQTTRKLHVVEGSVDQALLMKLRTIGKLLLFFTLMDEDLHRLLLQPDFGSLD